MDIQYIREFICLAKTGSYFETAEKMYITPSSLSRHIKSLELEIGTPLFDRTTRRVSLSRHGCLFLPYAQKIVRVDDERKKAFSNDEAKRHNTIHLGSIPLMKPYHITDLLVRFQNENKDVSIDITEGHSASLVDGLCNGKYDFAFIRDRDDPENEFSKLLYAEDCLCVALPTSHSLASQDTVTVNQLTDKPLLLIGKNDFLYKLCINLFEDAGVRPNIVFVSHKAETLIDLVVQGMGFALLMEKPALTIIPEHVALVKITPMVKTRLYLAWQPKKKMRRQDSEFLTLAEKARIIS